MSHENPGLVVDDLARRYGRRWALARVSFSVEPGSACQITGANGSGKSTLLRCLSTALQPHHGSAMLGGRELWTDRRALRERIAFLSHDSRLYDDLSGRDNLRVWARLGTMTVDVDAKMRRVGLDPTRPDPVRAYSAGMKRRLALALALLKQPTMMLLDEPFAALDPRGRELILDVVRELRQAGAIVLVATHLPDLAATVCNERLHLDAGRQVAL